MKRCSNPYCDRDARPQGWCKACHHMYDKGRRAKERGPVAKKHEANMLDEVSSR